MHLLTKPVRMISLFIVCIAAQLFTISYSYASNIAQLINQEPHRIAHLGNTKLLALNHLQVIQLANDKATLQVEVTAQDGLQNTELFVKGPKGLKISHAKFTKLTDTKGVFTFNVDHDDSVKDVPTLSHLLLQHFDLTCINNSNSIIVSLAPIAKSKLYELFHNPYLLILILIGLVLCILRLKSFRT